MEPSSVVVLFPERSAFVASHPRKALSRLAQVKQENADLRRYVVDIALQIQNLKIKKRDRLKNSPSTFPRDGRRLVRPHGTDIGERSTVDLQTLLPSDF
jgi:hypothetical protein